VYANSAFTERQRDAPRADAEFDGRAFSCEISEDVNRRVDDRGVEHVR
jgi:hypothetical protein